MEDGELLWGEPVGAAVHIKTYGCSHNVADSERMAGLLVQAGYSLTQAPAQADVLLINSCSVKGPSEQRFLHDVRSAEKPLVLAGCVSQADPGNPLFDGHPIVGVKNVGRVVEAVSAALAGAAPRFLSHAEQPALGLPKIRRNPYVEIVPINSGCLGSCTYCKTVHARGRLRSHAKQEVLDTISAAVTEGVKEVWLTSEDVSAYGIDVGETLMTLLRGVAALDGEFMVRIGMGNPPHFRRYTQELIELLKERPDRFYHFLHIPVQAGSDAVLSAMNREYTREEHDEFVTAVKTELPDPTIMTDFIVGFPTESEEEFQETMQLARSGWFRLMNINKFYPRPNTPAARMRLLPTAEVARRCKALVALYEAQDPNQGFVGGEQDVLFTERGKRGVVGHTRNYVQVVLPAGGEELLGSWRRVRIEKANKYYLTGVLLPHTVR